MGGPGQLYKKRKTENYFDFVTDVAEFDNFYACEFICSDGYKWTSSEQYYQAHKYRVHSSYFKEINECDNIHRIYALGQVENAQCIDWEETKVELMYVANTLKFSQNQRLKQLLMSTDGCEIRFGGGTFWSFKNAEILQKLRDHLLEQA